jgi:hypothetical protein
VYGTFADFYLPSSLFVAVKPFVNPFSRSKEKKKQNNKTTLANNIERKALQKLA